MCLFPASPVGDLQALLDARVAEPVLPGPAVDCEQREFDHESVAIRERRPAERAATRHDEIGGCGDRLPLNRGVECVGTRREHLDKRSQQSALAQQRFERPSNPSAVGDRPAIDRRSDCLPGIDHPGDGVVVLVENPLVNLSHVPQRRNATDKKDSVQAPADGFQGQGFMRSPAIGQRLAGAVLGGEGIPAFDPLRFDGDEAFEIREGMAVEG
jgi:hypothetical protein